MNLLSKTHVLLNVVMYKSLGNSSFVQNVKSYLRISFSSTTLIIIVNGILTSVPWRVLKRSCSPTASTTYFCGYTLVLITTNNGNHSITSISKFPLPTSPIISFNPDSNSNLEPHRELYLIYYLFHVLSLHSSNLLPLCLAKFNGPSS